MWIRYSWFSYFTKNFGTSERSQKPVQLGKGQPVSSSGSREQRETPDVHVWEEDDVDSVKVAICTTHLLNVGNNFILLTILYIQLLHVHSVQNTCTYITTITNNYYNGLYCFNNKNTYLMQCVVPSWNSSFKFDVASFHHLLASVFHWPPFVSK